MINQEQRGPRHIEARGASMLPTILPGSTLTIADRPAEAIAEGDILCFLDASAQIVAHRVIERGHINGRVSFRVSGDSARREEWVDASTIIGVVTEVSWRGHTRRTNGRLERAVGRLVSGVGPIRALLLWVSRLSRSLNAVRRRI